MKSIFTPTNTPHTKQPMFFGEGVDIQRFDKVRYTHLLNETKKAIGFFWVPEEVNLTKDAYQFENKLSAHQQHIFLSNIRRQVVLDSMISRGVLSVLLPVCSTPESEAFVTQWGFFEGGIHSRSYTHIIQNALPNPELVFDEITKTPEIVSFAKSVSMYFDAMHRLNCARDLELDWYDETEHRKAFWRLLYAINALEAVRFFVSFACSWAFAESTPEPLMVGNAEIITAICQDENIHAGATVWFRKTLLKDEPEIWKPISDELADECLEIYKTAIDEEIEWGNYLFKDGSMLGLNLRITTDYMRWLGSKRGKSMGLNIPCEIKSNPLPWTMKYIKDGNSNSDIEVQTALQEKENFEYMTGNIGDDVGDETFKTFEL